MSQIGSMTEHGEPDDMAGERELAELYQQALTSDLEPSLDDPSGRRSLYEYWEKNFGEKVRQWRRERNWSQEDVADRLRIQGFDMHQTTVAKIERGTRPLRVAEAAAIAAIFRVPPLAVFLGPPPTQMPWALNQLHDMIASAQNTLDEMKAQMTNSAGRYVDQEAHVLALARILNQTALAAEMGEIGQEATNNEGGEDGTEA
jgi:transcriptional regulator with XRE-family HTH domain